MSTDIEELRAIFRKQNARSNLVKRVVSPGAFSEQGLALSLDHRYHN